MIWIRQEQEESGDESGIRKVKWNPQSLVESAKLFKQNSQM